MKKKNNTPQQEKQEMRQLYIENITKIEGGSRSRRRPYRCGEKSERRGVEGRGEWKEESERRGAQSAIKRAARG